jgi:hypothetical protein
MIDAPYKLFDSVKDQLDSNLLFVEIGSERGGGSTYYLNSLSKQTGNNFITVDIDPVYLNSSVTSATMSGEEWVEQHLPLLKNPKIGLIFLDNFDWINRPTEVRNGTAGPEIYSAIEEYRKKQLKLNNINSAISHLKQVKGMLPYMHDKCVIMFSDTWFNYTLDTFEGKGAGAVYLLMTEGFTVISASNKSNYILMARNIRPKTEMANLNIDSLSVKYVGPKKPANEIVYNSIT